MKIEQTIEASYRLAKEAEAVGQEETAEQLRWALLALREKQRAENNTKPTPEEPVRFKLTPNGLIRKR
jgi:hypothetical protein